MEWYQTANALGGTAVLGKRVTSGAAFVKRVEEGLPTKALDQLKRFAGLTDADLSAVIPRRTLTSSRNAPTLSLEQSDRVARVAGIVAVAQSVFGDVETARDWLRAPNAALKGEAPLRMLRTGSGGDLVESVLIRIEHGVYE